MKKSHRSKKLGKCIGTWKAVGGMYVWILISTRNNIWTCHNSGVTCHSRQANRENFFLIIFLLIQLMWQSIFFSSMQEMKISFPFQCCDNDIAIYAIDAKFPINKILPAIYPRFFLLRKPQRKKRSVWCYIKTPPLSYSFGRISHLLASQQWYHEQVAQTCSTEVLSQLKKEPVGH